MHYLGWVLKLLLFAGLFGLAIKNNQPVTLQYFMGYQWETTLFSVLLVFFLSGIVLAVLAMLWSFASMRKELMRLRKIAQSGAQGNSK